MSDLAGIIWQLLMIPFGFVIGGIAQRRHVRRLDERENSCRSITVNNLKHVADPQNVQSATMLVGQVVIATDYYKSFVTSLRNLIGGEARAAQSLMIRARREALLRVIEQAQAIGAKEVWNVRFAFSNINQMSTSRRGAMQVEILAYGTAVVRQNSP